MGTDEDRSDNGVLHTHTIITGYCESFYVTVLEFDLDKTEMCRAETDERLL